MHPFEFPSPAAGGRRSRRARLYAVAAAGALTGLLIFPAAVPLVTAAASPTVAQGTLYFTRFCNQGTATGCPADGTLGANVDVGKVDFKFDGTTFTLGTPAGIGTTRGADGIVFAPNQDLLVGGQSNGIVSEITTGGSGVTTKTSGVSGAYHLSVINSTTLLVAGIPGGLGVVPLSGGLAGNGQACTLSGTVTQVDTVLDVGGTYYFTSSTPSGNGIFGTIAFTGLGSNSCTGVTTKLLPAGNAPGYPAAHGMAYDPRTSDLFLFGANMIAQFDPSTGKVVGELVFGSNTCTGTDSAPCKVESGPTGLVFDQGAVDGAGHALVADNGGELAFVDYSVSGNVSSPGTVAVNHLASSLDDVAPLVGPGAAPITTKVVQETAQSGAVIQDTAHVNGLQPTGDVTFFLYGPTDPANPVCDDTDQWARTTAVALDGAGNATSPDVTAPSTPGTYEWVASYGGDANNQKSSSSCGDEPVTVTAPPPPGTITAIKTLDYHHGGSLAVDKFSISREGQRRRRRQQPARGRRGTDWLYVLPCSGHLHRDRGRAARRLLDRKHLVRPEPDHHRTFDPDQCG